MEALSFLTFVCILLGCLDTIPSTTTWIYHIWLLSNYVVCTCMRNETFKTDMLAVSICPLG